MGKNPISLTNAKIYKDQPTSNHTTMGVGGLSRYFTCISSLVELREVIEFAHSEGVPYEILGNGSNVLFSDQKYNGLVIKVVGLNRFNVSDSLLTVGAGVTLSPLCDFLIENEFSCFEYLYGIPATVGGALVMNAGAFGHNVSDNLVFLKTFNGGSINTYSKDECDFGYRTSRFKGKKEVIISATFNLEKKGKNQILKVKNDCIEYRKNNQPKGKSCGSVFKNPTDVSAGWLIDGAGLKGLTVGGAMVSNKHANFIINYKNATFEDVVSLIEIIKDTVYSKYSIKLEEEIKYLGNNYGFNG